MERPPPGSTRTDPRLPYSPRFRSVPEGDIERRLEAPGDGDEKLRRHHADDDEEHEVDGEGELAGLEALVPAQCQRQQADSDVDVPDPAHHRADLRPYH